MVRLVVTVLGSVRVEVRRDDGTAPITFRNNSRYKALLAYLVLMDEPLVRRETLALLLWPAVNPENARASLRDALSNLIRELEAAGFNGITRDDLHIHVEHARVEVDVKLLWRGLEDGLPGAIARAEENPSEQLLDDLRNVSPGFSNFRSNQITRDQDRRWRTIRALAFDNGRAPTVQEAAARALFRRQPTDAEIAGLLMRLVDHDLAELRTTYLTHEAAMNAADGDVSDDVQRIFATLTLGRSMDSTVAVPRPATHLGVYFDPFDLSGLPPDLRYLVIGFTDALFEAFGRNRHVRVYRSDWTPPPAQPGPGTYVLSGRAAPAGEMIGLEMTLTDCVSGVAVDRSRAKLSPATWSDEQATAVATLARKLSLDLPADRLSAGQTRLAPLAFDEWLQCEEVINAFHAERWEGTALRLTALTKSEPGFARGFSSLANLMNSEHFVFPGRFRSRSSALEAMRLAWNAVLLDPSDSRCHLAHAHSCMLTGNSSGAIAAFRKALDANPHEMRTLISGGCGLAVCGAVDEGYGHVRVAEHDLKAPRPQHEHYFGVVALQRREFDEAVAYFERAQALRFSAGFLAASLGLAGRYEDARKAWQTAVADARRRWGITHASETDIARWYLHLVPLAREEDWKTLKHGFAKAGAPTDHCTFNPLGEG